MRLSLFLASAILSSSMAMASTHPLACLSSREYITTLEYIRDHKEFVLTEAQSREIADQVSMGCSNASKRFIKVTDVLLKAGMPSQRAIETGLRFAKNDDDTSTAFLTVFRGAFTEKLLDLDLQASLDTALSLSENFKGNRKSAVSDFNKLVEFCLDKKQLDLPLIQCAKLASRVIKSGEEFDYKVGSAFIDLFNYLTKQNKANLATFEALDLSEYVVKYGPEAKENFIVSFEYALDKKGLDLTSQKALEFAKSMASRSVKEELKVSSNQ